MFPKLLTAPPCSTLFPHLVLSIAFVDRLTCNFCDQSQMLAVSNCLSRAFSAESEDIFGVYIHSILKFCKQVRYKNLNVWQLPISSGDSRYSSYISSVVSPSLYMCWYLSLNVAKWFELLYLPILNSFRAKGIRHFSFIFAKDNLMSRSVVDSCLFIAT